MPAYHYCIVSILVSIPADASFSALHAGACNSWCVLSQWSCQDSVYVGHLTGLGMQAVMPVTCSQGLVVMQYMLVLILHLSHDQKPFNKSVQASNTVSCFACLRL